LIAFWPGPKARGNLHWPMATFCCTQNSKGSAQKNWNGKFNELAKVPSGTECLRSQLLFSSSIFFGFLVFFHSFGRNYFQQICQIKLHVQEAAADIASLEGPKFGCLRIELKSWCGLAVAASAVEEVAATPSKMPQINVHSFCFGARLRPGI